MSAKSRFIARAMTVAIVTASLALPALAQARPRHIHHRHAAAVLVPAHQRPGYAEEARAALLFPIDLGLGPVFPFSGVVLK